MNEWLKKDVLCRMNDSARTYCNSMGAFLICCSTARHGIAVVVSGNIVHSMPLRCCELLIFLKMANMYLHGIIIQNEVHTYIKLVILTYLLITRIQ